MQFGKAKPLNLLTLTHFQLFFQWPKAPKKEPKSLPKWSLWAPKITEKTEKQTLKKHTKKWMQKLSKKEPKRTIPFRAEKSPKSQKSEPWAQNVPQASRRGSQAPKIPKNHQKKSPRASKIAQNHENLITQNQENPKKKIQEKRCGTVAGYARSALDTLSKLPSLDRITKLCESYSP